MATIVSPISRSGDVPNRGRDFFHDLDDVAAPRRQGRRTSRAGERDRESQSDGGSHHGCRNGKSLHDIPQHEKSPAHAGLRKQRKERIYLAWTSTGFCFFDSVSPLPILI